MLRENKLLVFGFFVPLLFCLTNTPTMAAEFSANTTENKLGLVSTGKIFVKGDQYRLEQTQRGQKVIVLVDRKNKTTRVLKPEEKQYMEYPAGDFRVLSNDPFQAAEYIAKNYETKPMGIEKIAGFSCEKKESSTQGQKMISQWIAKKLAFPIKIVQYHGKEEIRFELLGIQEVKISDDLFVLPAGYTQLEDPQVVAKRKKEELKKKEESLPALMSVGKGAVPCMIKIGTDGELRVPLDSDRWAEVRLENFLQKEAEARVLPFNKGKQVQSIGVSPWMFSRKGESRNQKFNDPFFSGSFKVDELRIKVKKGIVYATLTQWDKHRKDFYNRGNLQNGKNTNPKLPVTIRITGDNPFGRETTGKFFLQTQEGKNSEKINFTVKNGKTQIWNYSAEKSINGIDVAIALGQGRAKISVVQPAPQKNIAGKPQGQKKKQRARGKRSSAKEVQKFSVQYPSGRGASVNPNKDLLIVVTGRSSAKGEILLYKDRKKKQKIGSEKFALKKDEIKSWKYAKKKHVAKISVWVSKGSFEVRLDQSSGAKP